MSLYVNREGRQLILDVLQILTMRLPPHQHTRGGHRNEKWTEVLSGGRKMQEERVKKGEKRAEDGEREKNIG